MSVTDVANALTAEYGVTIPPRAITMLFYERQLRTDLCPIVAGRRRIPPDYVPQIVAALRRRGRLQRAA